MAPPNYCTTKYGTTKVLAAQLDCSWPCPNVATIDRFQCTKVQYLALLWPRLILAVAIVQFTVEHNFAPPKYCTTQLRTANILYNPTKHHQNTIQPSTASFYTTQCTVYSVYSVLSVQPITVKPNTAHNCKAQHISPHSPTSGFLTIWCSPGGRLRSRASWHISLNIEDIQTGYQGSKPWPCHWALCRF